MRRHKKSFHTDPATKVAKYQCSSCNAAFGRKDTLTRHEAKHNASIPACEVCSKRFPRPDYLATHRFKCAKKFLERACETAERAHRSAQHNTEGLRTRRIEADNAFESITTRSDRENATGDDQAIPVSRADSGPTFVHEFALDVNIAKQALKLVLKGSLRHNCFEDYEDALLAGYHLGIDAEWLRKSCSLPPDSSYERWRAGLFILEKLQGTDEDVDNFSITWRGTALNLARDFGFASLLEPLFWKGADFLQDDEFVSNAIKQGHLDVVRFGLALNTDLAHSYALVDAILHRQRDAALTLMQHGVDINDKVGVSSTVLEEVVREGKVEEVGLALTLGANPKIGFPLHHASYKSDDGTARLLIEHGADVSRCDDYGQTVLHHAALNGTLQLLRMALIEDSSPAFLDAKNNNGSTALHLAIARSDSEAVAALLEAGADIHLADSEGLLPLAKAAGFAGPEVTRVLLDGGADPNAPCRSGCSPLFQAIRHNNLDTVGVLLTAGARVNEGAGDISLLELALVYSAMPVVEQLLEAGVQTDGLSVENFLNTRDKIVRKLGSWIGSGGLINARNSEAMLDVLRQRGLVI